LQFDNAGKEYIEKVDFMKKSDEQIIYYPQYLFRVDDKEVKKEILNKVSKPSQRHSK